MRSAKRVAILLGLMMTVTFPAGLTGAAGNQQTCTPHAAIIINEDFGEFGFEWINPVTGEQEYAPDSGVVSGSGTEADPYRIEGWCIVGTTTTAGSISCNPELLDTAIRVSGTTKHFVIANNTVTNWEIALEIHDLAPGTATVENVTFSDNFVCTVTGNNVDGIEIRDSTMTFTTGELYLRSHVILEASDDVVVAGNTLEWSDWSGIEVDGDRAKILDNYMFKTDDPVRLGGSNFTIAGNDLDDVQGGMWLWGADGIVQGNEIDTRTSAWAAVLLDDAPRTQVLDNRFENLTHDGLIAWGNSDGLVVNNTLVRNAEDNGIYLSGVSDVMITNTTLVNTQTGVYLYDASNVRVQYTEIGGSVEEGVYVTESDNVQLSKNNIEDNAGGGLVVSNNGDTVDAEDNWWGCSAGPDDSACDQVNGAADYDPWLTTPASSAGSAS